MKTQEEVQRLASVTRAEAEDAERPVAVRLAMASRAAQLYWVLGNGYNTQNQMEMEMLAADLADNLKTHYVLKAI